MLSHILRLYDKQSLLNCAGNLQIRRVSGLKKMKDGTDDTNKKHIRDKKIY